MAESPGHFLQNSVVRRIFGVSMRVSSCCCRRFSATVGATISPFRRRRMITVGGKVLGKKKPLFADWSIPFPPDLHEGGDRITLRDLIARIVRGEVEAFRQGQEERRLVRALTATDIDKGVVRGK